MNLKKSLIALATRRAAAFLLVGLLGGSVAAAEAPDDDTKPLRLRLTLVEETICQFEPAILSIELQNRSEKPRTVMAMIEPEFGFLGFEIVGPDGIPQEWGPPAEILLESVETVLLAPGKLLRHREMLLYSGPGGLHFKRPGEYQIRAVYHAVLPESPPVALRSEAAVLRVEPAGGIDAKALERFGGVPQAKMAVWGFTCPIVADEFEAVVNEFPDSIYAPWSYYFLGRYWQRRSQKEQQERQVRGMRKFNPFFSKRAIATYQELLERHPEFPLAVEVRYQIAKESLRLGQEDALSRIERLHQQHSDLRLLQRAHTALRSLREENLDLAPAQVSRQLP